MSRRELIPIPELRRLVSTLATLQTRVGNIERGGRSTQLSNSSIENGYLTIRDGDGLPRGYWGIQPDGTAGVRAVNGPPPPRPNTPDVTGIMDGVLVSWNGEFVTARPLDFAYLNVYVSGAGPDFIEGPSNLVTQFTEAGDFPVTNLGGGGTYWVRFVAYNTSGKPSEPSLTGSATSQQVVAQDVLDGIITTTKLAADAVTEAKLAASAVTATKIADDSISSPKIIAGGIQAINLAADSVSAGKIAADAVTAREIAALTITANEIAANSINATHITAGAVTANKLEATLVLATQIIVGTAGGDRVQLHPTTGIEQWLSGTRTLSIPPSGMATFSGEVTVGQGVGVGPTIVLDPAASVLRPALLMYPSSGTNDVFAFESNISPRPGGTAAGMHVYSMNQNGFNGLSLEAWSTNVWLGQKNPNGSEAGGIVKLQQTGQAVIASGGSQPAQLFLNGDGGVTALDTDGRDLYIDTGTGSALRLFDDGVAQLLSSDAPGGVKAFVIDHPTDPDRWLVHGCIEAPDAYVLYEGWATIVGYRADVELPAYFESLVREDSRSANAWVPLPDAPVFDAPAAPKPVRNRERAFAEKVSLRRENSRARKPVGPFPEKLYRAAASTPKDGRFRISSDAPDGTLVRWEVTAARKAAGGFAVEPLKNSVQVAGDGPYRYTIPNVA